MLKKVITYTDFNDVEQVDTFYFNFSKPELLEMELSFDGGLSEYIKKISEEKRPLELVKLFKDIILKAYGQKSADGKSFVKSEQLSREFSQTAAFVALYMELSTNADAASAFFNGLVSGIDKKN